MPYFKSMIVCALFAAGHLRAEPPRVVTDIAPIHSLVAQVMVGIDTPTLTIPAKSSPHNYALRPSQVAALADANIVFIVDTGLTPWIEEKFDTLAPNAKLIVLSEINGTFTLPYRESAEFEDDSHKHEHDHEEADDHATIDPHLWLDPKNAVLWLPQIARELAKIDSINGSIYHKNAEAAALALQQLNDTISTKLAGSSNKPFVVFHDGYQYFERRFGLAALGAISLGDASSPSPKRIQSIKTAIEKTNAKCIFSEPQFNKGLIETVTKGLQITVAELDPMGVDHPAGPDLYAALLVGLTGQFHQCLNAQ